MNFINNFRKVILLSTESLNGYGLHRIFLLAKEAGFHGIDLTISFDKFDTLDIEYIKKISEETGIQVLSISAPGSNISETIVDKLLDMSGVLGSQVITFSPPHFSEKDTTWYQKYLSQIKKSSNISICVQNVEPKFLFFIIPARKNASLIEIKKVTGDTAFDVDNSSDIMKDVGFLGNSIKNVYLNDALGDKKGLLLGSAVGGTSNLPIESLLMKLKANGYNGLFSLKVKPSELGAGNEQKVITNLKSCIEYYEKYFSEESEK